MTATHAALLGLALLLAFGNAAAQAAETVSSQHSRGGAAAWTIGPLEATPEPTLRSDLIGTGTESGNGFRGAENGVPEMVDPVQVQWFPAWEEVHIYWPTAPGDGGSSITHYELQVDDGEWMATGGPSWEGCTLHSDFGLIPGRSYEIRVRAVNENGAGDPGEATITLAVPPSSPELTAESGDNSVTLKWDAPSDGGSAITHYGVTHFEYQVGAAPLFVQTTQIEAPSTDGEISHNIAQLDGGTSYLFQVWAISDAGWGPVGTISAITGPAAAPQAPTIARVYPGDESLAVTWTEPAIPGAAISSYDLRYIDSGDDEAVDANWTRVTGVWSNASGGALTHTLADLANSDAYGIQVRATNLEGTSS